MMKTIPLPGGSLRSSNLRPLFGILAYGAMVVGAAAAYLAVRFVGESAFETAIPLASNIAEPLPAKGQGGQVDVVFHVLATLAAVIGLGYALGRLVRFLGQPPVIGEVIAGICLGPSLLGAISPALMYGLIPAADVDPQEHVTASLKTVSQLGVLFYMFVVGLELNMATLKHRAHAAVAISHVSILAPFLLGATLALWLHPILAPQDVTFTSFSLFLGVAMSITAFPVLARILTDRGMESTRLGTIALTCAAVDDVTAWCLLALVVGVVQAELGSALWVGLGSLAFIAVMFLVVRPALEAWCARLDRRRGPLPQFVVVAGLVAVLVAASLTETIGIHAIFGAFLLGVVIPDGSRLAEELKLRLRDGVTFLLLPAFFAYTGMRTELALVSGLENWLICLAIIVVATLGKFGGTLLAARTMGTSWREAAALGTLMNTRGLMELIILNVGLDLGVISPTLFAMMVLMALATTMATAPLLVWLAPPAAVRNETLAAGNA